MASNNKFLKEERESLSSEKDKENDKDNYLSTAGTTKSNEQEDFINFQDYNLENNQSKTKLIWEEDGTDGEEDDEGSMNIGKEELSREEAMLELLTQLPDLQWQPVLDKEYVNQSESDISAVQEPSTDQLIDAIHVGDFKSFISTFSKLNNPVHYVDEEMLSLLHWTAIRGRYKIAEYLMENGAYTEIKDLRGFTPLHYACKCRQRELVELLLDWSANKESKTNQGLYPIDLTKDAIIIDLLK